VKECCRRLLLGNTLQILLKAQTLSLEEDRVTRHRTDTSRQLSKNYQRHQEVDGRPKSSTDSKTLRGWFTAFAAWRVWSLPEIAECITFMSFDGFHNERPPQVVDNLEECYGKYFVLIVCHTSIDESDRPWPTSSYIQIRLCPSSFRPSIPALSKRHWKSQQLWVKSRSTPFRLC
jgi:hypothetical protein